MSSDVHGSVNRRPDRPDPYLPTHHLTKIVNVVWKIAVKI